jgi:hypothetical protein
LHPDYPFKRRDFDPQGGIVFTSIDGIVTPAMAIWANGGDSFHPIRAIVSKSINMMHFQEWCA